MALKVREFLGSAWIAVLVVLLPGLSLAATEAPLPANSVPAKGEERSQREEELQRALKLFESFQDEKASAALRELLTRRPPAAVVSKAHLYLGLILFNGNKSEEARDEFKLAMRADPAIELPLGLSPKTRLAFDEARQELSREVSAAPEPARPPPAPSAATSLTPGVVVQATEAPRRRSHWLTWTLGALGVAAGAVAVYGGVELLNYGSMVKSGAAAPGSVSASQLDATNAPFWSVGWIVAAAVGAAGVTSAGLVW